MERENAQVVRIVKRLSEAIGYYELGMTQQSIASLDRLTSLGELGIFKLAAEVVRAEALKREHRYDAAAAALEKAARLLPAPHDQSVWFALSMCYRQAGDEERAVNSLGCARGAKPPQVSTAPWDPENGSF